MKKTVLLKMGIFVLMTGLMLAGCSKSSGNVYAGPDGVKYVAKADAGAFSIYRAGKWEKTFIKGVNIGAGKPGAFPGELAITKEEYLRWFKYIGEMNANVIRVYTTLKPDFYEALYEYNQKAKKPLYLLQGVWINEEDIAKLKDAFAANEKIKTDFINEAQNLVDVIHGNASLPERQGHASGNYTADVSPYVLGWILGIEWDPVFVNTTNANHPQKPGLNGKYLYTQDASPFEVFLGEVGEAVIDYETEKYQMQRPLSFTNWVTTDMLKHPNEPIPELEDSAVVNTEHIKASDAFKPGMFASYHIYPYYPDFMNYQKEYITYTDEQGKINTYRAYLKDLKKEHTVPVLVAEFGVPAARGIAHRNIHTGFNQGNLDEKTQGLMDAAMLNDIYQEGYAGAVLFAWQDEWFKRTWNTMDLDIPDRRPYWSNPQTNEQEFGLLAFDPGANESICYVDGDIDEWRNDSPVYANEKVKLYVKSDEKYIYLMADTSGFDLAKDTLIIPVDTIQGQGNKNFAALPAVSFSRPADFVIVIDGEQNARMLVDGYYDVFYFIYGKKLKMIEANPVNELPGQGVFNPIYLCLNRPLYLPAEQTTIPFARHETGRLVYGDGNPQHAGYNSLADYCVKNGKVEIRIPWQLFNVMDPSTKMIMGDLYANQGIKPQKVDGFYFGAGIVDGEAQSQEIGMNYYSWQGWEMPTYHERLKPSYYLMQQAFSKYLNPRDN